MSITPVTVYLFDLGYWRYTPQITYRRNSRGKTPQQLAAAWCKRRVAAGYSTAGAIWAEGEPRFIDQEMAEFACHEQHGHSAYTVAMYKRTPPCEWSQVPAWWGPVYFFPCSYEWMRVEHDLRQAARAATVLAVAA